MRKYLTRCGNVIFRPEQLLLFRKFFLLRDVTHSNVSALFDRLELMFVGFSAYSNLKRVFTVTTSPHHFPSLDSIRFLTFAWVSLAHSWVYGPLLNELWETANLRSALLFYPRQFAFQIIINVSLAVDTFCVVRFVTSP